MPPMIELAHLLRGGVVGLGSAAGGGWSPAQVVFPVYHRVFSFRHFTSSVKLVITRQGTPAIMQEEGFTDNVAQDFSIHPYS